MKKITTIIAAILLTANIFSQVDTIEYLPGVTTHKMVRDKLNEAILYMNDSIASVLSSELTATRTVGGVSSGDVYPNGTSFSQILRDILAPYNPPSFTGLTVSLTPTSSYYEVGEAVTVGDATFSYSNDSEGNPPQNMYLSGSGFNKAVTTSPVTHDPASVQNNTATSTTWTLSGEDKDGNPISNRNFSKTWRYRYYFGASSTELTAGSTDAAAEAVIESLQQSALLSSRSTTWTAGSHNNTAGNYTYIAYKQSFGDITTIIQNGALPVLGAFTKLGDFTTTNAYGVTVVYRLYKSNADNAFSNGTTLNVQ